LISVGQQISLIFASGQQEITMQFLAIVTVLCPLASALAFPGADPTASVDLNPQGSTPRPTDGPSIKELLRRQSDVSFDLIEGPDNVCGYQDGDSRKIHFTKVQLEAHRNYRTSIRSLWTDITLRLRDRSRREWWDLLLWYHDI
jgi:hypothetical protein